MQTNLDVIKETEIKPPTLKQLEHLERISEILPTIYPFPGGITAGVLIELAKVVDIGARFFVGREFVLKMRYAATLYSSHVVMAIYQGQRKRGVRI